MRLYTLSLALPKEPKDWIQVALVGRWVTHPVGPFEITPQRIREMAANHAANPRGRVVIDFEHQTLYVQKNGQPAPAGGWVLELQGREADTQLWARVEWTGRGSAALTTSEYAFVSPTIILDAVDARTGKPIGALLHSVALTNNPYLNELPAVAASNFLGDHMKGLLALLLPILALSDTATEEDAVKKVKDLKDGRAALCGALGLAGTATDDEIKDKGKELGRLAGLGQIALSAAGVTAETPAAEAEARVRACVGHAGMVPATEVTALREQLAGSKADQLVRKGVEGKQLVPATESWFRTWALSQPVEAEAWLKTAPRVIPGAAGDPPKHDSEALGLTAEELKTATVLGLTAEQYKAAKAKESSR